MDVANVTEYHGFPTAVLSLTALTSLTLSGWTYMAAIPEGTGDLTALQELLLFDCAATKLPFSVQRLIELERLDLTSNCLGRYVL